MRCSIPKVYIVNVHNINVYVAADSAIVDVLFCSCRLCCNFH